MLETHAYAAHDAASDLRPYTLIRREPGPRDVLIEILYCGVCHSDLHQVRNEWKDSRYPMVPGHEVVGRVARVGADVTRFRAGELAGVGCFVGSCGRCEGCRRGLEQYCEEHVAWTYNGTEMDRTTPTQGGYAGHIVVDERYVLRVDPRLPLDRAAPLLCAGVTTYSPLRHWKVGPGHRLAVLGLGGLGHMAVKLAVSLGAEVTLLSSSASKRDDARRLGAHEFVLTSDDAAMAAVRRRFDFILDTVAARHPLDRFLELLRTDGTLILVGVPDAPLALPPFPLILGRRSVAGSLIGGIAETQELLDHCAVHGIAADVETIPIQGINAAYARMLRGDVRYRFVIDAASLRDAG